jgi:hypothetical protein
MLKKSLSAVVMVALVCAQVVVCSEPALTTPVIKAESRWNSLSTTAKVGVVGGGLVALGGAAYGVHRLNKHYKAKKAKAEKKDEGKRPDGAGAAKDDAKS